VILFECNTLIVTSARQSKLLFSCFIVAEKLTLHTLHLSRLTKKNSYASGLKLENNSLTHRCLENRGTIAYKKDLVAK
jgi:hypothetical protein